MNSSLAQEQLDTQRQGLLKRRRAPASEAGRHVGWPISMGAMGKPLRELLDDCLTLPTHGPNLLFVTVSFPEGP